MFNIPPPIATSGESLFFSRLEQFFEKKNAYNFLSHEPSMDEERFLFIWNGFLRHTALPTVKVCTDL